jgi:neurotransmitter-gated ion-channel
MKSRLRAVLGPLVIVLSVLWAVSAWADGLDHSNRAIPLSTSDIPLQVEVGIEIDQITSVDQKAENYGAVAIIRFRWDEPALAFDPSTHPRPHKVMRPDSFIEMATEMGLIIPSFVVGNQQHNRWIQQSAVAISHTGSVQYFEQSTLTLQAPDFNFTRYPFDRQTFYLELVSVYPSDVVSYVPMTDLSGLGDQLGEEEWILGNDRMIKSTVQGLSGEESSRVALAFEGSRHVMYYALRIFLPMLVLVTVSWSVFFLDEYRKRIEIAGANLLVFVAFNWAISDDLPRLGYLTFLDFILQCMFVVTGAIIVVNVLLRRLKLMGREALATRLDVYVIKWIYPLGYAAIVAFAVARFLIE